MNKVLEWFNDNTYYSVKSGNVTFDIQNDDYWEFHRLLTNQCYKLEEKDKEIERLNNIINELTERNEKAMEELKSSILDCNYSKENEFYKSIIDILQGSDE